MKNFFVTLFSLATLWGVSAQGKYQPTAENLKNRETFQDNKFGVFIHWGIYSMLGAGEWALELNHINEQEYQKLASGFYPSKFDAAAWVSAIKGAGAKYITITSRHHDGFSMWDTQQSDYNIVKATPFGRDVIKELAEECRKQGIALHFYYSHLDWHHTDYYPLGRSGHTAGRSGGGDWANYRKFMNAQVSELLTNYGPIGAIWFDGWWDKKQAGDWQLETQYQVIHDLQPGCLIGNNHHLKPFDGEDFQMFERDLPGQNASGFSPDSQVGNLPLETCETMNDVWGYQITDSVYKSTASLIQYLVKAAGNNANLLLNIGPQPNGEIPSKALQHFREMGEWMKVYGETIYGTRGGVVSPRDWGVTTQKENKLFVHILNLKDASLYLPVTGKKVKKATRFVDGAPVGFVQDKEGVLLHLGAVPTDVDYVVTLEF